MTTRFDKDASETHLRRDEFVELLAQHRTALFGYIVCIVPNLSDAEDVFQQATMAMWDSFSKFQSGTDFRAWGIRIARSRALNFIRSKRRERVFLSERIIEQLTENVRDDSRLNDDRMRALAACREKLTASDLNLLELCYGQSDTIRDAAKLLGRPLGAVYESLWRIRRALYTCIQKTLAREGIR